MATIGALLQRQPPLSRRQLSLHLCSVWNWRTDTGQYKDIAARSLLRKLEQRGLILLPPIKHLPWAARSRPVKSVPWPALGLLPSPQPVAVGLAELSPIELSIIATKSDRRLWAQFLEQYHYLSWNRPIGESIAYWAHDCRGRLLALSLWGTAAWKAAPRDQWIGWSDRQRVAGLKFLANNQRFLVLPWVSAPPVGSHLLGQIQERIRSDWQQKYQHDLYLLESFVQSDRFQATLYRAAHWLCVGQTQGRSRQDRFHQLDLPRKSIWMAVLEPHYQQLLYETPGLAS